MLTKGPAKKVTIFVNEDAQHHLTPLDDAIMTFLMHKGVTGATATRAFSGYGSHRTLHTPNIEVMATLPIRIEFIDTAEIVEEVLPTLYDMVTDGLIEVQDTTVVKLAGNRPGRNQSCRTRGKKARPSYFAFSWVSPTNGMGNRCTTQS